MKTIKQSQEVSFHAISFRDAIILLPIMDELVRLINHNRAVDLYQQLPQEEQGKYHRIYKKSELNIPTDTAEKILDMLNQLGFESQISLTKPNLENFARK